MSEKRFPTGTREDKSVVVAERPSVEQDVDSAAAQRDAVFALSFHAFSGYGPDGPCEVHLLPRGEPDLTGACRREDQELERQLGPDPSPGAVDGGDRGRDLGVRKGRHVAHLIEALGECRGDGVARGVVLPVALRDGPLHDRADSPAHLPGRLVLAGPDGHQDGHDVCGRDLVDGLVADVGVGVLAEGRPPKGGRLAAVLPAFAMDRDHLLDGVLKRRRPGLPSVGQGIAAVGDGATVGESAVAGHCEGDHRPPAQAEIVSAAFDGDPLHPVLPSPR